MTSRFLGDRTKLAPPAEDLKAYAVGWFLTHPASTGRVHITSAEDVDAPLDLHPGFLDRCVSPPSTLHTLRLHGTLNSSDPARKTWRSTSGGTSSRASTRAACPPIAVKSSDSGSTRPSRPAARLLLNSATDPYQLKSRTTCTAKMTSVRSRSGSGRTCLLRGIRCVFRFQSMYEARPEEGEPGSSGRAR